MHPKKGVTFVLLTTPHSASRTPEFRFRWNLGLPPLSSFLDHESVQVKFELGHVSGSYRHSTEFG